MLRLCIIVSLAVAVSTEKVENTIFRLNPEDLQDSYECRQINETLSHYVNLILARNNGIFSYKKQLN